MNEDHYVTPTFTSYVCLGGKRAKKSIESATCAGSQANWAQEAEVTCDQTAGRIECSNHMRYHLWAKPMSMSVDFSWLRTNTCNLRASTLRST